MWRYWGLLRQGWSGAGGSAKGCVAGFGAWPMQIGNGTVQRQPLQRIYRCLCSSLRTTCSPVCRRVETSVFHRQRDGTTRCRGTVCPSGTYFRVIVRFHLDDEAITLQTNASMRCRSLPTAKHALIQPPSRWLACGVLMECKIANAVRRDKPA